MEQPTDRAVPPDDQAWADAFLAMVLDVATKTGRSWRLRRDLREDIAQDIVLYFLERIRDGRVTEPPEHAVAIVRRMVLLRAISRHRSDIRRRAYEAEFAPQVIENAQPWSDPVEAWRRRELDAMRPRVLARLSERRRKAYLLVREQKLSYVAAGRVLGLERRAVKAEVVAAEEEILRALPPRDAAA